MKKIGLFLSIAFLTFVVIIGTCYGLFAPKKNSKLEKVNQGWNITYNGVEYEKVDLNNFSEVIGQTVRKGDMLELCTYLDGMDEMQFPTFLFFSRYSAWEIYWNDEFISSMYMDRYEDGKYIGCKYNFVTLPFENDKGIIRIKLYVNEDNAYYYMEPPTFGSFYDVRADFVFTNLFAIGAGIVLLIFGSAFLLITLTFYKTLPDIISQLFSSLLFIDLGIWILSRFRILDLFIDTNGRTTEVEYIALYLIVPIIFMIIGCIHEHYTDWAFMIVAFTCTFICMFLIALHYTEVAHLNKTIPYYQVVGFVCFLFVAVIVVKDVGNSKLLPAEKIQLMGLGTLTASFILNIIFYALEITGITGYLPVYRKAVPLGALVFMFTTLVNYFIYISESFARRREYASLTHLAYADGLTDLANRSRYDKYMADLDSGSKNYCVVSLDLNGLKLINDKSGHLAGDNYLKEFSVILKQCFEDKAFLARIGGDEFVAVLTEDYLNDVDSLVARLKDSLEVKNVLYPTFRRSVATGYAFRSEIKDADAHSVYLLADKRMYENKKIMHEKLGISVRV